MPTMHVKLIAGQSFKAGDLIRIDSLSHALASGVGSLIPCPIGDIGHAYGAMREACEQGAIIQDDDIWAYPDDKLIRLPIRLSFK